MLCASSACSYSCPKFITASQPAYDNPSVNTNQQVKICMEVCFVLLPIPLFFVIGISSERGGALFAGKARRKAC